MTINTNTDSDFCFPYLYTEFFLTPFTYSERKGNQSFDEMYKLGLIKILILT